MAYTDTTFATVLTRVVARLQSSLSLTDATCYLTADRRRQPMSPPSVAFYTVAPGPGDFDQGMLDGGGREQLCANPATLYVTIWTKVQRDEPGHATAMLTDATDGLVALMDGVLESLCTHALLDGSGNEILREPLSPLGWEAPEELSRDLDCLHIRLSAVFDWNLD